MEFDLFVNGGGISVARIDGPAIDVVVGEDALRVILADGRELMAPLAWAPRLRDAPQAQRDHLRLIGRGHGIHLPHVDEDISVSSLMRLS